MEVNRFGVEVPVLAKTTLNFYLPTIFPYIGSYTRAILAGSTSYSEWSDMTLWESVHWIVTWTGTVGTTTLA